MGQASMLLGAGRVKLEDTIDYSAGIVFLKSYGDYVKKGEPIAIMYSGKESFSACEKELGSAITVAKEKPQKQTLIFEII